VGVPVIVISYHCQLRQALFWMTDAVDAEVKDETEEPVDLIPTLIPLQPDEVCI